MTELLLTEDDLVVLSVLCEEQRNRLILGPKNEVTKEYYKVILDIERKIDLICQNFK